jgi:hypothetical protein
LSTSSAVTDIFTGDCGKRIHPWYFKLQQRVAHPVVHVLRVRAASAGRRCMRRNVTAARAKLKFDF